MASKLFFRLSYWLGMTPWDSGITPPEVIRFIENNPPGRAIDLGCGTGTNVITLAENGWSAEGVDYAPRAIRIARRAAKRKGLQDQVHFRVGSVVAPEVYDGGYDLILDIGCFHNLSDPDVEKYIRLVESHLAPAGSLLLYVHLRTDPAEGHGASEQNLQKLEDALDLVLREDGDESSRPSAWLEFKQQ